MLLNKLYWTLAFALFLIAYSCGTRTTLTVPTITGEVRLHFYPSRISEQRLGELGKVSPYRQEDFLVFDATSGQEQLDFINGIEAPREFQPVLTHVRRQVAFYLCLERAKIAYYEGADEALKPSCDDIDPSTLCPLWVHQAPLTRGLEARKFLAGYTWHNCMISEFHERIGDFPMESWQHFLNAFNIKEEVIEVSFD